MCHFPVAVIMYVHQYVSGIFKKAYFYSCSMKNEDNFEDDCWLHAKEAARLVDERRKEVTHKYHKKAAKLQEEVEDDCEKEEGREVVVVLLGLPASGKSTLCRHLKERAVERGETVLTVPVGSVMTASLSTPQSATSWPGPSTWGSSSHRRSSSL